MDTNTRTFAKTSTYRLATFVLTYVITFLLLGQHSTSAAMAVLSITIGALTYIIHERIWNRVRWGTVWVPAYGSIDYKIRSIMKTITYRLWSLFIVFVVGLLFGFTTSEALSLTVALNIMYLLTHYTNERVWNKVKWGKI